MVGVFWWFCLVLCCFVGFWFEFTACSSFGILILTAITNSILADTFFLQRREKVIKLLSFHVQVFAVCILEAGNMLLFICFYYCVNTEVDRMVV